MAVQSGSSALGALAALLLILMTCVSAEKTVIKIPRRNPDWRVSGFVVFPYETLTEKVDQYILPLMSYWYDDLIPYIEEPTVTAHHQGETGANKNAMQKALWAWRKADPDNQLAKDSILNIMKNLDKVPLEYQQTLRNHGGGFVNHCFYWSVMSGNDDNEERRPQGQLLEDINSAFGNFDEFKKQWNESALNIFGSGYVWLVRAPGADPPNLSIITTANQDSPVVAGLNPILVLDMWEHSWYMKHNYQKANYVKDWWMVVDYDAVAKLDEWWVKVDNGDFEKLEAEKYAQWLEAKNLRDAEAEEKKKEEEKKEEEAKKSEL